MVPISAPFPACVQWCLSSGLKTEIPLVAAVGHCPTKIGKYYNCLSQSQSLNTYHNFTYFFYVWKNWINFIWVYIKVILITFLYSVESNSSEWVRTQKGVRHTAYPSRVLLWSEKIVPNNRTSIFSENTMSIKHLINF